MFYTFFLFELIFKFRGENILNRVMSDMQLEPPVYLGEPVENILPVHLAEPLAQNVISWQNGVS
jgi:hypothetical protein